MANVQYYGTGRRKHSVARVRLVAGEGNIIVNGRAVEEYFNYETLIRDVKQPLVLTNNENKYDVIVKVEGGGFTGQAGAIRHGISRALLKAVQGDNLKKYIKYVIFAMVALILMTASIYEIKENSEDVMKYMPVTNKVIILDAGHGGIDSGTLNDDKTILEKDINLAITHKIRELLESSGAHVILTREDDSSLYVEDGKKTIRQKYNENLKNRKKIIEESNADMFISIHMNALVGKGASKYYGAQTFYPAGKEDSIKLSKYIQQELKRVVDKTNNREVKPRDDLYLLKDNDIPSVLIECGFLSNDKEAKLLTDEKYQEKIAWSIYAGIQNYFTTK